MKIEGSCVLPEVGLFGAIETPTFNNLQTKRGTRVDFLANTVFEWRNELRIDVSPKCWCIEQKANTKELVTRE